jgi:hypothetical protein
MDCVESLIQAYGQKRVRLAAATELSELKVTIKVREGRKRAAGNPDRGGLLVLQPFTQLALMPRPNAQLGPEQWPSPPACCY